MSLPWDNTIDKVAHTTNNKSPIEKFFDDCIQDLDEAENERELSAGLLDENLVYQAEVVNDLNSVFEPHEGQVLVGRKIFYEGVERVFVQCGRKWGKTTITIYLLFRWAMSFPSQGCYYLAPFVKQAKEIIWADGRLKNFLTPELKQKYGYKENNTEMRIHLGNGSFIKVEGTDNPVGLLGINPHFVVVDEIKDIKPQFWEGFEPNLAAHDAPCIFVGTPPDNSENLYCHLALECQEDEDSFYLHRPTSSNPHISKKFLAKQKLKLLKRSEIEVWHREYLAEVYEGGSKAIFPMFDKDKHVIPVEHLITQIMKSPRSFDFCVAFDPGTASVFGALFIAVHKNTKTIFVLDEIYAKRQDGNTSKIIFETAREKWRKVHGYDDDWTKTYDYAATWFANEILYEFDEVIDPCTKDLKNKEAKISLIKDCFLGDLIVVGDNCEKFIWEMASYKKDENGRIPKENDHLIDAFRYGLNALYYFTVKQVQQVNDAFGEELFTDDNEINQYDQETILHGEEHQDLLEELYYG